MKQWEVSAKLRIKAPSPSVQSGRAAEWRAWLAVLLAVLGVAVTIYFGLG